MPGSCPRCYGSGRVLSVPVDRIVVRPEVSIKEGAIRPWPCRPEVSVRRIYLKRLVGELARELRFDMNEPWASLDEEVRRAILYGVRGRTLRLITYFQLLGEPQAREFDGLVALFDSHFEVKKKLGREQPCPVCEGKPYEVPYAHERIEAIVEEHGASGLAALALTSLGGAILITEKLTLRGIPYRAVPDLLPEDNGVLDEEYGRYRRWVVFVARADLPQATEVMEARKGAVQAPRQPVLYISGAICREPGHLLELEPCSWCDTGWDWMAKADRLGRVPALKIPPNTL